MESLACEAAVTDLADRSNQQLEHQLEACCCFVLTSEAASGDWQCAIVLTTDAHVQQLHRDFMGIDSPTDILTFEYDESETSCRGGDIIISVERADHQRQDVDWSLEDELLFLVAHGALHLTGWEDETAASRAAMLARQMQLVRLFQSGLESAR